MNTAHDILTYAKQHHIHMEFNGEKLVMKAPSNLLTEQFISEVKKHKAELIQALTLATLEGNSSPSVAVADPPELEIKPGLSAADESKILKWFTAINETDPDIIAEILENCRTNPKHREYFLERAEETPPIVVSTGNESWAE